MGIHRISCQLLANDRHLSIHKMGILSKFALLVSVFGMIAMQIAYAEEGLEEGASEPEEKAEVAYERYKEDKSEECTRNKCFFWEAIEKVVEEERPPLELQNEGLF